MNELLKTSTVPTGVIMEIHAKCTGVMDFPGDKGQIFMIQTSFEGGSLNIMCDQEQTRLVEDGKYYIFRGQAEIKNKKEFRFTLSQVEPLKTGAKA